MHDFIRGKDFDIININTLQQMSYASNSLYVKDGTIQAVEVERIVKDVLTNLASIAKSDPARYGKLLDQAKKDYKDRKREDGFFPSKGSSTSTA